MFAGLYALAMIAFTGMVLSHPSYRNYAPIPACTGAAFGVAALAPYRTTNANPQPSSRWVAGILLVAVAHWIALWFLSGIWQDMVPSLAYLLPFVVAAFLFLRVRSRHLSGASGRTLRLAMGGAIVSGAAIILLTLALTTTQDARGWQIVTLKAPWITYDYDLAAFLRESLAGKVLRDLFAVAGCAAYVVALIAAVVVLVWFARSRGSLERLSRLHVLPWLAAAACMTTFWVFNDIYWGWQAVFLDADEPSALWPACVALVLEFAACAAVLLLMTAALRQKTTWRGLGMVQVAQLPLATFNFMMMANLTGDPIDLPGLLLLMIGLQLLTWGLLAVLLLRDGEAVSEMVQHEKVASAVA